MTQPKARQMSGETKQMPDKALMDKLANAIRVVNDLSVSAKTAGDDDLMYAANRAWHQLDKHARAQEKR
jgi:hypothetical protein